MANIIETNVYGQQAQIADRRKLLKQQYIQGAAQTAQQASALMLEYAINRQEQQRKDREDMLTGKYKELNSINLLIGSNPELAKDPRMVARHHQLNSEMVGEDLMYPTNPDTGEMEIPRTMQEAARYMIYDPKTGGLSKEALDFIDAAETPDSDIGKLHHDAQTLRDRGVPENSREIVDIYRRARVLSTPDFGTVKGGIFDDIAETQGPMAALQAMKDLEEAGASKTNLTVHTAEGERKFFGEAEAAIEQAKTIKNMYLALRKKGVYPTGKVKGGFLGSVGSYLNQLGGGQLEQRFRKLTEGGLARTLNALAGSALNDLEAQRYMAAIPKLQDSEAQFLAALDTVIAGNIFQLRARSRVLEETGVDVPGSAGRYEMPPDYETGETTTTTTPRSSRTSSTYVRPGRPTKGKRKVSDLSTAELQRLRQEKLNAAGR